MSRSVGEVMVSGTEAHAFGLRYEVAAVLSTTALRLSEEKTMTVHIDEGFASSASASSGRPARLKQGVRLHVAIEEGARASIMAKVKTVPTHAGHEPLALHPPAPVEPVVAGHSTGTSTPHIQYQ